MRVEFTKEGEQKLREMAVEQDTTIMKVISKAISRQRVIPPEYRNDKRYTVLGPTYYCKCGQMHFDWEIENINYCHKCGQKMR